MKFSRVRGAVASGSSLWSLHSAQFFVVLLLCSASTVVLHQPSSFSITVVQATSAEPFQQFPGVQYNVLQPFQFATLPADEGIQVLGVTVQTIWRDCTWGSHWSLPVQSNASDPLDTQNIFSGVSVTSVHNVTIEPGLCSMFIYPSTDGLTDTIGSFNVLLRSAMYFVASGGDTVPSPSTIRIGWVYWIGQRFLVGSVSPQAVFFCQPREDEMLYTWDQARGVCRNFFFPAGYKYDTANIASTYDPQMEWLVLYMRRRYSAPSTPAGFLPTDGYSTWIGYWGRQSSWLNGQTLAYSKFAPNNPKSNTPTVILNDRLWYSVSPLDTHRYCCESTANGDIAAMASGINTVVLSPNPSPFQAVVNLTMNYDDVAYFPFQVGVNQIRLITRSSTFAFGFTAAVDQQLCTLSSIRWTLDSSALPAGVSVFHDVEVCHVFLFSTTGQAIPAPTFRTAILRLRILTIGEGLRPAGPAGTLGTPFYLVWQYWLQGPERMYLNRYPVVHSYKCVFDPVSFDTAHEKCSQWGMTNSTYAPSTAGRPEGYLATLTDGPEDALLSHMRALFNGVDTIWIGRWAGDNLRWTNGDDATRYRNWAANQPQSTGYSPTVLSNSDRKWYSVPSGMTVDHTYCCERTAIPSRGDSGVIQVTPLATPRSEQIKTRLSFSSGTDMFPFARIRTLIGASALTTPVAGVTIQLDYNFCNPTSPAYRWVLRSQNLPSRITMCPKINSNSVSCSGEALFTSRCTLLIYRDDGTVTDASTIFQVMENLQFVSNVGALEPQVEIVIGWSLWTSATFQNPMLEPRTGHEYWCNATSTAVGGMTFMDSLESCRRWSGMGYLTTLQSRDEESMFNYARFVANGFRTSTQSIPIWLGRRSTASTWLNGDALNYTARWRPGEPTELGPTVVDQNGQWYNVAEFGLTFGSVTRNAVCCERNAFGGAVGLSGQASVIGPTHTRSQSHTPTEEPSLSETRSRRLTTPVKIRTPPETFTDTMTQTFSAKITQTEQLTLTLNRYTKTQAITESRSLERTITPKPVPTPPPAMDLLNGGVVQSEAIRGVIDGFKHNTSLRTVSIRLRYSTFRVGITPEEIQAGLILTPRYSTFYGFSALRNDLITLDSFNMSTNILNITFNVDDMIEIADDEIIYLDVNRSLTYATAKDGVGNFFPRMSIIIRSVSRASTPAQIAVMISTAIAALGSPSAFKDAQTLALFGAMKCARGESLTFYWAAERILSPLKYSEDIQSPWVGSFGPSFASAWLHIIIVLYMLWGKLTDSLDPAVLEETLIRARFPSASLFIIQLLHIGVTFYSIELVKLSTSKMWFGLALWGVVYCGTLTLIITYWSYKYKGLHFSEYQEAELVEVPKVLRAIVPYGRWEPKAARRMCYFLMGEFQFQQYASAEYWVGGVTSLIAAYLPDEFAWCVRQYAVSGGFYTLVALLLLYFRPYRSYFCNVTAVISQLLLAGMAFCGATMIYYPFGYGNQGAVVIRWMLTALCMLRGVTGLIVFRLEMKLVGERMKVLQAEAERQQRSGAILKILDHSLEEGGVGGSMTFKEIDSDRRIDESPLLRSPSPRRVGYAAEAAGGGGSPKNVASPLASLSIPSTSKITEADELNISAMIPVGRSIYSPDPRSLPSSSVDPATGRPDPTVRAAARSSELDRRRKLQAILDDDLGVRPEQRTSGGLLLLPDWIK